MLLVATEDGAALTAASLAGSAPSGGKPSRLARDVLPDVEPLP